jgi:hypothetical protein
VRHYYEEIGFELIGRAQKPISSVCLTFQLLFHIVLEEECGGAKLGEDFTFEQNDREFMKINPKILK